MRVGANTWFFLAPPTPPPLSLTLQKPMSVLWKEVWSEIEASDPEDVAKSGQETCQEQ